MSINRASACWMDSRLSWTSRSMLAFSFSNCSICEWDSSISSSSPSSEITEGSEIVDPFWLGGIPDGPATLTPSFVAKRFDAAAPTQLVLPSLPLSDLDLESSLFSEGAPELTPRYCASRVALEASVCVRSSWRLTRASWSSLWVWLNSASRRLRKYVMLAWCAALTSEESVESSSGRRRARRNRAKGFVLLATRSLRSEKWIENKRDYDDIKRMTHELFSRISISLTLSAHFARIMRVWRSIWSLSSFVR